MVCLERNGKLKYNYKVMSVTTSHHISRYYDYYRDKEIVFTKANLKSLRIDPRQIYLKSNGGQWPCIINSSSLQQAKVIVGTSSGIYGTVQKNKTAPISIRYCFFDQNNEPIQFSVNCNVIDIKPFQDSNELAMLTLNFTQRPPDDFRLEELCRNSSVFLLLHRKSDQ